MVIPVVIPLIIQITITMCNHNLRTAGMVSFLLIITTAIHSQNISDHSIKKNITAIDRPLQKITQLEPKQFEYNTTSFKHLKLKGGQQFGFIAEEAGTVFPHLVSERSISYGYGKNVHRNATVKTINEISLIPVLVAAIKEQQVEIEKLRTEIAALQKQVASVSR